MKRAATYATVLLVSLTCGCQRTPTYATVPPPPPKSASVAESGYQEGYRMGVKDVQHGRRFEVARHSPYQQPPFPPENWDEYRAAYTHGYRASYGKEPLRVVAPPPPVAAPSEDPQERGYQDGYRMGTLDIQQGKEFAVARHTEFRYPPVAPEQVDAYRNSYQYGYRVAYGMEPPPDQNGAPQQPQDTPAQ